MSESERTNLDPEFENRQLRERVAELEKELTQLRIATEGSGPVSNGEASLLVAQIRRLMDDSPLGFALLNADFRYEVVNEKLAEMNGIPPSQHVGRSVEEVVPHLAGAAREAFEEVLATGKPILDREFSGERARAPGEERFWSISWIPVRRSDGRLLGVGYTVRDVTERKVAQDALRISQQRLELAQSAAGIGAWDWDLQANKTYCSREYGPLYGLPPGDYAPPQEEWLNLIHPDDRARIQNALDMAIAGIDDYGVEFRVIWPDDTVHWLFGRARVFRDAQGNATRVLGVNMDITERKLAEQALRESEERFRSMADAAPLLIFVSGADGLATFFNKGWLSFTGRTIEQELGDGWTSGLHPEDRDRALAAISASLEARSYCYVEYRLRRADGEFRWVLCNGSPRFEQDGTFAGYNGSALDITDFKRAHEASLARQRLQSLGVMAGGVAHDFNNLLGSILADTELLQSELGDHANALESVERIKLVAARAGEIVRELMAYSGQEDTEFEPVNLSTLVGETLHLLNASISKRAVLKLDLPEELPAIPANAPRLRQLVLNLILNASEALGDKGGVISVAIRKIRLSPDQPSYSATNLAPGDYIRLEVSDTGCGIPEEVQANIFDPFFTTKATGRGLGLSAVQGIVKLHGGEINLSSAPGRGSRFEILLPGAGQATAGLRNPAASASVEKAAISSARILMVEDEASLRIPVAKLLHRQGFDVLEAGDGITAVDVFRMRGADIDVVLLDMTLPSLSGPEVLEEMRRMRPELKVILTSAYSHEIVTNAISGQKSCAYIRKPYSPKELADLLWTTCLSDRR